MVKVAMSVLASTDLFVDLTANIRTTLSLLLDEHEDVELFEALSSLELFHDHVLLVEGVGATTGSNEQDGWLNKGADLFEGLVEVLLSADAAQVGARLEVREQLAGILVKGTNALREDGRGLVAAIGLLKLGHALLAQVLRAFKREDSGRLDTVLDEELGLELALREVLEENAGHLLVGKLLNQSHRLCLLVALAQVVVGDKAVVVEHLHV